LINHIATHCFVLLDDFLKAKLADPKHPGQLLKDNDFHLFRLKARDKGRKLTLAETACLSMLFQVSACRSIKAFLLISRPWLAKLFPSLPSYSVLVGWLPRIEPFLVDFLDSVMAEPGGRDSIYLIDSSKIDPHKLKNNPKCMRGSARIGHSHEGMWLGWKVHVVANRQGEIVAWDLTPANRHDLDPVKGGLLDKLSGTAFAGGGYVSEQQRQNLKAQDLAFIAKPRESMVDARWIFDKIWRKPYRQRQVVEGVFNALKNICGMVGSTVRRADSSRCRVLSALALYCMPNWVS
jgi:hypothetical protein